MSIVAAIAHAHGGSVQAANRPEGGAVVTISLPVSYADERPPAAGAGAAV
jgi:signal transduction histidine kinase